MASGGESVVAGQVKQGASNSTLLPAAFLQALGLDAGELPPRQAVRLADNKLEAYRYANLRPKGIEKPVTLYTVPTSAGVATVACVDPSADCESIANTLKLNGGTAFPVGPSKEYASTLSKALGGLDKKVQSGRKALQSAKTPKAQAAAAKQLSSAYKDAAATLSKADVSPADAAANQELVVRAEADGRRLRQARVGGLVGQQGRLLAGEPQGADLGGSGGPRAADDPGRGLQDRRRVSGFTPTGSSRSPERAIHIEKDKREARK